MTKHDLNGYVADAVLNNWAKAVEDPEGFFNTVVEAIEPGATTMDEYVIALRDGVRTILERPQAEAEEAFGKLLESLKPNKGRKITLATADRLFNDFIGRVEKVDSDPQYGMSIGAVLLFGSYLERRERVGDIDLVLMRWRRSNFRERANYLARTNTRRMNVVEQVFAAEDEVMKFVKGRSCWYSFHALDDFNFETPFSVVFNNRATQLLADKYKDGTFTPSEFLAALSRLESEQRLSNIGE